MLLSGNGTPINDVSLSHFKNKSGKISAGKGPNLLSKRLFEDESNSNTATNTKKNDSSKAIYFNDRPSFGEEWTGDDDNNSVRRLVLDDR